MAQSIGQKLAAARKRRDLTVEDVAHETRIRAETRRHLEADDYSGFDAVTYAKSFLTIYSKHLGLDIGDHLKEFGGSGTNGSAETERHNGSRNGHRESDSLMPVVEPPKRHPVLALVAIILFVSAVPGMYILGRTHGFQSAKRFTVERSSQVASSANTKSGAEEVDARAANKSKPDAKPAARDDAPEGPTIASRPADRIEEPPVEMPDTLPTARPTDIELPPPPADDENVEVRRAAILIEDDEAEDGAEAEAEASADGSSDDSGRPEVRSFPRAIPVDESN